MILGKIVFDHRPPLALRTKGDNANDPDRLVAICTVCDRRKTPRDIKDIARAKRLAFNQQDFADRMRDKVLVGRCPRGANGKDWCAASKDLLVDGVNAPQGLPSRPRASPINKPLSIAQMAAWCG